VGGRGVSRPRRIAIRSELDARRAVLEATQYALELGFGDAPSRMVATAISELARNILKYAHSGEIAMRRVEGSRGFGIEIEAVDQGPGIADPEAAMEDHFSSGGTLGLGLPGVRRMMDEFALESTPGEGVRVTALKWK
jgi:serine/threonine-protein kinase RsbT